MKTFFKIIGYAILGIMALSIFLALFHQSPEVNESKKPSRNKKWTEVYSFKGNGLKKSSSFYLYGNNSKLKYKYKGELFSAYVIPEGHDLIKDGGIPDILIQQSEEGETSLQKSEGKYYIYVNSIGTWEILIEEEK